MKDLIIFDQNQNPMLVSGDLYENGVLIDSIGFIKEKKIRDYIFGDCIFMKFDFQKMEVEPLRTSQLFAETSMNPIINQSIRFLSNKLDVLINQLEGSINVMEKVKSGTFEGENLAELITNYRGLLEQGRNFINETSDDYGEQSDESGIEDETTSNVSPVNDQEFYEVPIQKEAELQNMGLYVNITRPSRISNRHYKPISYRVKISTDKKRWNDINGYLDTGSPIALIDENWAKHHGIKSNSGIIKISGITNNKCSYKQAHLFIKVKSNVFELNCAVIPNLKSQIEGFDLLIPRTIYQYLKEGKQWD